MHEQGTRAYSHAAFIHGGVSTRHYREQWLRIDSLCNHCIDSATTRVSAVRSFQSY